MIRSAMIAFAAATLVIPATASAQQVEIEANGPVIELSVFERVTAEPDLVTIGAGVTSNATTAVEAMRLNAAEMQRVIDRIKPLGIPDQDIQTTGINLSPRYDYDRVNQRQIFRGYTVSNRVSVKLREIEATGELLDALVVAGATDLSGPSFSIENDEAAKDIARASAVRRAEERAAAYAAIYGYGGVRVLSITEAIQGFSQGPQPRAYSADAIEEQAAPIQPGLVSTGVSITIKYEMVEEARAD